MLSNAKVSDYVEKRTKQAQNDRLMDVTEALLLSASIARGENQQAYSKQYDHLNEEVIKEMTYTITPNIEERQRSLDHILKVHGAYLDKHQIEHIGRVSFVDDIN